MPPSSLSVPGILLLLGLWLCTKLFLFFRHGSHGTKLGGPPRSNLILGLSPSPIKDAFYAEWVAQYGPVYEIPATLGRKKLVITDPTALLHVYNAERTVYTKTESSRTFMARVFGRGILWAEGEVHKRQRRALSPAFSNAAIRKLTAVFYDSVYKVGAYWDETFESTSDDVIIDVESWMNRIALDSIGIAGFSHDFRSLAGEESPVTRAFAALQRIERTFLSELMFGLSFVFPIFLRVPTQLMRLFWDMRHSLDGIAENLLENTRREREGMLLEGPAEKSLMGVLLKAEQEDADLQLHMTKEEVAAQLVVLLLAGYETTSATLTWALMELAWHPETQDKLRKELDQFGADPTWDQLVHELPFLNATVLEVLRLHPAVPETERVAAHDDIIPLGTPIITPSGETITSLNVAAGTGVILPIRCVNRSDEFWGADAKVFKPERWFEDITDRAKELQGYHHLLTFHDGPRICLGRAFALAEIKAVISVLIRQYAFEFPDGRETKIEEQELLVSRPKVVGHDGTKVPLRVRRVE
ncbi:cytochrome P450 [Mycena capillaripes]|nr:cytochrome P450 [Mycena capillaripes]